MFKIYYHTNIYLKLPCVCMGFYGFFVLELLSVKLRPQGSWQIGNQYCTSRGAVCCGQTEANPHRSGPCFKEGQIKEEKYALNLLSSSN